MKIYLQRKLTLFFVQNHQSNKSNKRCPKIYVTWFSMFKQLEDVDKLRKHDRRCTIAWNYFISSNKYNIIINTAHFTFRNLRKLCKEKRCYTSSQIIIKSSIKFILRRYNWCAEIDIYLLILCQKLILLSVLLKNSINISSQKMCWEEWRILILYIVYMLTNSMPNIDSSNEVNLQNSKSQ